jgi:TIR domain
MKVFLSWSGERSKAVAEYLHKWLPLVIQSVKPWFSPDDIEKGDRWLANVSGELEAHSVAIVCLTLENRAAPWLLFEAGALSKALNKAYVCPLLLGLEPADVQGPLAQFQLTPTTKDEVRKLLGTINGRLEAPINDGQLDAAYEAFWPQLEKRLSEIAAQGTPSPTAKRSKDDLLSEILERVRGIERRFGESGPAFADVGRDYVPFGLGSPHEVGARARTARLAQRVLASAPASREEAVSLLASVTRLIDWIGSADMPLTAELESYRQGLVFKLSMFPDQEQQTSLPTRADS